MTLTIDLVAHLDAVDRAEWPGDQDQRPLTELGRRQAQALADALAAEPVDALYSGPALRCRQTIEPLAERLRLAIDVLPGLGEFEAWNTPAGWDSGPEGASVGAFAAGTALAALERIESQYPEGRAIACSHGHIIPALVAFLIAAHGLASPPWHHRGQWYRLRFEGERVSVELQDAAGGFPR